MNTDPKVLSDGQLFHLCATVFEEHAEGIFVYAKDGRRLIAELRKRAGETAAPVREDVAEAEGLTVKMNTGEVALEVHPVRTRADNPVDGDWMPNPIPGHANIRISIVDEVGGVADMEFGNAAESLTAFLVSFVIEKHAETVKSRGKAQ